MGGVGSGTWYRWDKQTTLEETKRIDIRYMRKQSLLIPGYSGVLSWTSRGQPSGKINFTCFDDFLLLHFRYRTHNDEWESVEQHVFFDETTCNYGGYRKWFLCPKCTRRVEILCAHGKLFLCRHCYHLPYGSHNEGYLNRLINQKHKLGERIFQEYENGFGWRKKKWMHQKTFDRLYARYIRLEQRILFGMASYVERMCS